LAGGIAGAGTMKVLDRYWRQEMGEAPMSTGARGELRYGTPQSSHEVVVREGYSMSYDQRTRNAAWTAELLTSENLKGDAKRKGIRFQEDSGIAELFRAQLSDYHRSGYDRGHLVPAADMKASHGAMQETFLLTNISPQVGRGFNRDYWERLERWCRELTEHYRSVVVISGPLWLPTRVENDKRFVEYQLLGSVGPGVAVPTHFFKVVVCEDTGGNKALQSRAFVLPNKQINPSQDLLAFAVQMEDLSSVAGLQFFDDQITGKLEELPVSRCRLPGAFMGGKSKL